MRCFITSDLHYGVENAGDEAVEKLAAHVCDEGREDDVLLIAGDIAVDDESIRRCLSLFARFAGRRAAIAGNHDIWVDDGRTSLERYAGLSAIFRNADFHPLEEEPLVMGDIGFAGAMGWYDLSFRDEGLGIPDDSYRAKAHACGEIALWCDALFARWGADDEEVAAWQAKRLERQLAALAGVRDTIVLLHHVPTKKLLFHPRFLVPKRWRFLNAFLGSERFSEIARRAPNVSMVVNGHMHMSNDIRLGMTRFVSIGSGSRERQLIVKHDNVLSRETFNSSS